jgi:hypothetical protein
MGARSCTTLGPTLASRLVTRASTLGLAPGRHAATLGAAVECTAVIDGRGAALVSVGAVEEDPRDAAQPLTTRQASAVRWRVSKPRFAMLEAGASVVPWSPARWLLEG